MRYTKLRPAACALALAALAAAWPAPAARSQRVVRGEQSNEPYAGVVWANVSLEFDGNKVFESGQFKKLIRRRLEDRYASRDHQPAGGADALAFDRDWLDYYLRTDVLNFMRGAGYLQARTGEPEFEMSGHSLRIKVPVVEGEFYRLGEIKIEGAKHFTPGRLRKFLPLKQGDVADGPAVARWLSEHVKELYGDDGFIQFDYEVEPRYTLEDGADAGVADLLITITEGPRFTLRKIGFDGNLSTPEEVLRKAMLVREGEFFSARKFKDSIQKLRDLDLFEPIDLEKDSEFRTDEENGELWIVIRLVEKS